MLIKINPSSQTLVFMVRTLEINLVFLKYTLLLSILTTPCTIFQINQPFSECSPVSSTYHLPILAIPLINSAFLSSVVFN